MKLTISFDKLLENLDFVTAVVEDKFLDDTYRNIIFRANKQGVSLIGYNSVAICKTHLQQMDYSVEFDELDLKGEFAYMQIKSKELNNFLNSFKTLNKTKPTEAIFETVRNKVRLTVVEEFINNTDEAEQKPQKSVWVFDNLVVKDNIAREIAIEADRTKVEAIQSPNILLYLNSLLPLVSDEAGNTLPSKMNFSDDYVFVVPSVFATLFKNMLPDAFKGMTLGYSALNFLKKLLVRNDIVEVHKSEVYLMLVTDTTEAFLRYQTKISSTETYLKNFKKDHAIVLDRLYTKDVLKRLSIINENTEMTIKSSEGVLEVKNSKFSQNIPILQCKDMEALGDVKFKLATQVAVKAIIGDDAVFTQESGEIRIYISPVGNSGYMLCFSDATDSWFSTVQVR